MSLTPGWKDIKETVRSAPWPRNGVWRATAAGDWFVPAQTSQGTYYHVRWEHLPGNTFYTCSCPDPGDACWHIRAAQAAERADGIKPPPAEPNTSALTE